MFKKLQVDTLLNAIYEANMDPMVRVVIDYPGVEVPPGYDLDGMITLSMKLSSMRYYNQDDEEITFSSTYGGKAFSIIIPYGSIVHVWPNEDRALGAIYPVTIPKVKPEESGYNPQANIGWHKKATVV